LPRPGGGGRGFGTGCLATAIFPVRADFLARAGFVCPAAFFAGRDFVAAAILRMI
jgi:hypothetical protein